MSLRPLELTRPSRWAGLRIAWPAVGGNRILYLLLALTLVRGVLYAALNPPFGSPDERAHFQFVQHLATNGAAEKGAEGHQPIPYYALMVPAYWQADEQFPATQLLAIRLASLPLLLGTVFFTWLAARRLAPDNLFVANIASAIVALHPQLAYIGASANNDSAASFMAAVVAYSLISTLSGKARHRTLAAAALAIGAALMTKGTIIPIVAVSAVALLVREIRSLYVTPSRLAILVTMMGLAATLVLQTTEGRVLVSRSGQILAILGRWPEASMIIQQMGWESLLYQFTSFWAAFLGEAVRPSHMWYLGPAAVLSMAPLGYALEAKRRLRTHQPLWPNGAVIRVVLLAMVAAQLVQPYLWHTAQALLDPNFPWKLQLLQGRYLLVMLPPLALLLAEGSSLLLSRNHWRYSATAIVTIFVAFDASSLSTLAGHYSWPPPG